MQRISSIVKTLSKSIINIQTKNVPNSSYSTLQKYGQEKLLQPAVPIMNIVCNFKVKGRVRRRCKACYMVVRDERLYVICPKFPRHKQMAMKPKPLTEYILTHASQSRVRPW